MRQRKEIDREKAKQRKIKKERNKERYLLRGHVKGQGPHVHLLVGVNARNDEEDSRTASPAAQETTEPENDNSFVLLDHLKLKIFNMSEHL